MSDESGPGWKGTNMPTIKELLRSDPALVPLEAYNRAFAFLGLAEAALSDEQKKHQYLTKYRLFTVLKQGCLLFAASLLFCVIYFLVVTSDPGYGKILELSNYVPPGNIEITSTLSRRNLPALSSGEVNRFLFVVNFVRFAWSIWIIYRMVKDFVTPGAFFSTRSIPGQYYLPEKMVTITAFSALIAFALISIPYHGLFQTRSIFAPSIFDLPIVFSLKTTLIISLGFWILEMTLFLTTTLIRQFWSQLRG